MEHDKHITHYIVLITGILVFVVLIFIFRFNRPFQLLTGLFGAVFYVSWGIIHHSLEHRLTREVVTEYLLFGVLAFIMLFFALNI